MTTTAPPSPTTQTPAPPAAGGDLATTLARGFGVARMGVGLLSWFAPNLSARLFGLGREAGQPIVSQLFAAREFALGALTATSSGPARAQVLKLGVAIDAVDTVASLGQIRQGRFGTQAKLLVAAGAAFFAALGMATLAADDQA